MSWVTILTMFTMAAATAFLVMAKGWTYVEATCTVTGIILSIISVMWAALVLLTPPRDRQKMWGHVIKTMRQDLRGLIDLLTGKPGS